MNVEQILERARAALGSGALAEAEASCRSVLAALPKNFDATVLLGEALLRQGRHAEAIDIYEQAVKLKPDHSALFTATAANRFRQSFGPPPRPRPSVPGLPRIQMTSLGSNGRFGNQLLQYAFVRLYARAHGLAAELPDWIGRDLFDFDDPLPSGALARIDESEADFFASLNGRASRIYAETDISGYFCGDSGEWGMRRDAFRGLFVPGRKVAPLLEGGMRRLRAAGRTIVAIHLRHGDFGYGEYWIAPLAWYLPWLRALWPTLEAPVLYLATEEGKYLADFAEFAPWDARRLGVDIPGANFMADHHVLTNADWLAISNSTFSFSAAMLNKAARGFVRPDPNRREMTAFDPWASPVLLRPVVAAEFDSSERDLLLRHFGHPQTVLHLGRICAPWTNFARANLGYLKILEAEAGTSVDSWRRDNDVRHLNHLVIEDSGRLSEVLRGASASLGYSRIDMIHFWLAGGGLPRDCVTTFADNGYRLYRIGANAALELPDWSGPARPGRYFAIQERLLQPPTGPKLEALDMPGLRRHHSITVRGVIHVGAHEGKEIEQYDAVKAERVLFIEANPAVYARLAAAMAGRRDVITVQRAISDRPGKVTMHLASFDQSSSLLPLAQHLEVYPQIVAAGTVEVETTTLDALMAELGLAHQAFNLLAIDVQGAEMLVLAGAAETLRHIEIISIEVNFAELYRGGAQIEEIDDLLGSAGFKRVATLSPFHETWGDAFYVRKD